MNFFINIRAFPLLNSYSIRLDYSANQVFFSLFTFVNLCFDTSIIWLVVFAVAGCNCYWTWHQKMSLNPLSSRQLLYLAICIRHVGLFPYMHEIPISLSVSFFDICDVYVMAKHLIMWHGKHGLIAVNLFNKSQEKRATFVGKVEHHFTSEFVDLK